MRGKPSLKTGSKENIYTRRLLLRDLRKSDLHAVHEYASVSEVVRYMDWGPSSLEESKAFIRRAMETGKEQPRRHYTLAVTLRRRPRLIGSCGITVSNPENREGWIGYCLNKCFWDRGYGTEVARALVDFGFKQLSLHRVFATCDPANAASSRVLEKAGMRREGHIRQHKWVKMQWRDSYLYAVLEEEWGRSRLQCDPGLSKDKKDGLPTKSRGVG